MDTLKGSIIRAKNELISKVRTIASKKCILVSINMLSNIHNCAIDYRC